MPPVTKQPTLPPTQDIPPKGIGFWFAAGKFGLETSYPGAFRALGRVVKNATIVLLDEDFGQFRGFPLPEPQSVQTSLPSTVTYNPTSVPFDDPNREGIAAPTEIPPTLIPTEAALQTSGGAFSAPSDPVDSGLPEGRYIDAKTSYGHEIQGSVIDRTLTFNGNPWDLVGNGENNMKVYLHISGERISRSALAERLQTAVEFFAKDKLNPNTYPDLYKLFHLCNGTATEFNGLINENTINALHRLGVV